MLEAAPEARVLAIDRDPAAIAAGRHAANPGRLTLRRGQLRRTRPDSRGGGLRRPTAWCSTSASPRCSSTIPNAASPSRRTARSTCACRREARPPPTSSTRQTSPTSPTSCFTWARSAARVPSPGPSCGGGPRNPSDDVRTGGVGGAGAGPPEDRGRHAATRIFQALRIYVNDELGELARGLAAAERVLAAWRPSGGRHLPFAGGWSRQAFPARAGVPEARGSRHLPPGPAPLRPPSFRLDNPRPIIRRRRRSTPIPAPAPQSCGWRFAPTRRPGRTTAPTWRFHAFEAPR